MTIQTRFLIILTAFLNGCDGRKDVEDIEISNRLKIEVERFLQGQDSTISMARICPHQWDSLYIFQPYTSLDQIDKELGFHWVDAESSQISHSDTFCLGVFVREKRVVSFGAFQRSDGDFFKLSSGGPFTRNHSDFVAREELFGNERHVFFVS